MNPLVKTLLVIGLRHVAPMLGGAGLLSENDYGQIASWLILGGSFAYHVYQRHQGKKVIGAEINQQVEEKVAAITESGTFKVP